MPSNCPNCGAPITDDYCPYCGTVFHLPAKMMIGKTIKIEFEHEGLVHKFDMVLDRFNLDYNSDATTFYADGAAYYHATINTFCEALLSGRIKPKEVNGKQVFMTTEVKR